MEENNQEIEEKKKGRKIPFVQIGCSFVFIIFASFILLIILLVTKPGFFWKPFTGFMNKGIEISSELEYTAEEVSSNIKDQIRENGFGESVITITNNEITALARQSFPELPVLQIAFTENRMSAYWILSGKVDGNYLLGFAQIQNDSEDILNVSKLGTPKIVLPKFLNKAISTAALAIFTFGEEKHENYNLIAQIIRDTFNYEILDVKFLEGEMHLTIMVDV